MKAKQASHINENTNEAILWQASSEPLPALTPRERLQRNIQRLRSLDRRLSSDSRKQEELLTSIELIGFKIRHLARQIREAEQVETEAAVAGIMPIYPASPVC